MPTSPPRPVRLPSEQDLELARAAVTGALAPTPVVRSEALGVDLKLETLQPTGAFKVRGGLAALSRVDPSRSVVTASAGNHALGAAWAAQRVGRRLHVVVPGNASSAKVEALRRFDVGLELVGSSYEEAEARALELAASGAHYLSSYNDPDVVAGQATLGPELDARGRPLTVVCPLGGGGLLAGLCLWARDRSDVRLIGVEAAASRAMSGAIEAGAIATVAVADTIADGLAGNLEAGSITFPIVRDRVDEIVAVTEAELGHAIRFLVAEHGLVAEGAGAAAVAAVLAGTVRSEGTAVAIVSGRNIAPALLASLLERSAYGGEGDTAVPRESAPRTFGAPSS